MILFAYTCIVSILAFAAAEAARTQQTLNSNELSLSLSNEQVTQYKYEKTIQSAAIENNQDNSITTNINTQTVEKIHSSNELDLDNVDFPDINNELNVDLKNDQNGLDSNSNGNHLSDNSFMDSYQSSNYYEYNIQHVADLNGGTQTTPTSSSDSNGSLSSATPASPNSNLISGSSAASNGNGALSPPPVPMTYPIEVPGNINKGIPNYPQTSNKNSDNGAPKSNVNRGTPTTPTSPPGLNGSPNPDNGDLTDNLDSNGNELSDNSFMKSYQSSYYGHNTQNDGDRNGGIPTTPTSSSDSNGTLSSATPASPNSNVISGSSAASDVNGAHSQPPMPMTYPIEVPGNINKGIPNYPQTSNPNSDNGALKSNVNRGTPTTPTSPPSLNGSPNPDNGDLTDNLDSNGNHLSDNSFMDSYQSSNYHEYNIQHVADLNGGTHTTPTSSSDSNGTLSSATPASPNSNVISGSSAASNGNGALSPPPVPMTYPIEGPGNINKGIPNYPQTSNTNSDNGAPKSNVNRGTPTTPTSPPGLNGSPNPDNGDLTDNLDSNGNELSANSFMKSYQSFYYGHNTQNDGDRNGGIPTTPTSSSDSNGSLSSATPASPNSNVISGSSAASNGNGALSPPPVPMIYPIEVPGNINKGIPNYPQTSNKNSDNGAPKSNVNRGTPTTPTSPPGLNGSPNPDNGDLTDNLDSNGNELSANSFMKSYQSFYYGHNTQNDGDRNGGIPTTPTSSSDSNGTLSSATPASPNSNLISGSSAASNGNGALSPPPVPMTYPIEVPGNINKGIPNYPQTSNTNSDNGAPKSNVNQGTPTTPTSPPGLNGSPNPDNGDLTDNLDSNGNGLSYNSFMKSYQSSYYGHNTQNDGDRNGGTHTTPTSSSDSNGTLSSATPASPNSNVISGSSAASDVNGAHSQPPMPMTYPIEVPGNRNKGIPNYPQTSNPNPDNGDLTDNLDSNGNHLSDNSFMDSYQSSNYHEYNIQHVADLNGGTHTTPTSSSDSNGTLSSATPASPNSNVISGSSAASNGNGALSPPPVPMTYPIEGPGNINKGIPNYPQTSNTNSDNGVPKSNVNRGTPTTPTSPPGLNGSPNPDNGDLTDNLDSNGNELSANSFMKSYQSFYYGHNTQNDGDRNGGIPTTPTSSSDSNGTLSSATPASPNSNLISHSSAASNGNGALSPPPVPMTYPIEVPGNINKGIPNYPQTSNTNSDNGAPKSNVNRGTPTTPTSPPGLNGSPNPDNGDLTDNLDSNGNELSDNSFMKSYQSSYYGHNTQNDGDRNGGTHTTPTSSSDSNGTLSSATPASPNSNVISGSSAASNGNGALSPPPVPMTYPIEGPGNIYKGIPNYPQTSNTNSDNGAPKSNVNRGTPTTPTSPPGLNGSPNPDNGDLTDNLDSNGNELSYNSFMKSYQSSYYGHNTQNDGDRNGGVPTTPTSSSDSNGSPSSATPASPNSNVISGSSAVSDVNGALSQPFMPMTYPIEVPVNIYEGIPNYPQTSNPNSDNGAPKSNINRGTPTTLISPPGLNGFPSSSPSPNGKLIPPDQYSFYPGISSTLPNMNYGMGYELQNTGVGEVSNDGQLSVDGRYVPDNYNDINEDLVNFPLFNENGDVYNNYFYEKSSVNTVRGLDGDYNTRDDGYNVDSYLENMEYNDGYLQESPYDSYPFSLNGGYDNSEPFGSNTLIEDVVVPYDNNLYPENILYNYKNMDNIEYDQTKIGTDKLNPQNNQLGITDFNTFLNTQNSLTADSYLDKDLNSDRLLYNFVDVNNVVTEFIDSNYIGQVNENNGYDGPGFNGYNMQSVNEPEYNQLNGGYTTPYLSNLRTFEASPSNTLSNADIDGYGGPQFLNSEFNLGTSSDLNKQSSDLNKQSSDSNSFVIDNVQWEKYLYSKTDTSNVNTLSEGLTEDNSNGYLMKAEDNRLKSTQTSVLTKNNALDVGQNVYGANGQVIGEIRHKYSGSSSYDSPSDSELSHDIHAIGHNIKRATRGAIDNVHDNINDAFNTTKAVGNIVGNVASKAADGIEQTANAAYQSSKDAMKSVGNAVDGAVDDVQETAKTAYQSSKDVMRGVGNAVGGAVDDVQETAKNAYQGSKDVMNAVENAISGDTDIVEKTDDNLY